MDKLQFDFEYMSKLYKTDPQQFELVRSQLLDQAIESVPDHRQLKCQQLRWKIDAIHKTKNPSAALVASSKLMWESLTQMQQAINEVIE